MGAKKDVDLGPGDGLTYDIKSICKLIHTCKASGVYRLKLGDLEVRFTPDSARQQESQQLELFPDFADSSARDSAPKAEDIPPKVPKDLEERFAEEQQLLDDPFAFETRQLDLLVFGVGTDEET